MVSVEKEKLKFFLFQKNVKYRNILAYRWWGCLYLDIAINSEVQYHGTHQYQGKVIECQKSFHALHNSII